MGRAEKMACMANGEVIFTGATTEFQLRMGLTHSKTQGRMFIIWPLYLNWNHLMKFGFVKMGAKGANL